MGVQASDPVSIWQLGGPLLEGPVWVERDAALWFTDIKRRQVYRYDPVSGDKKSWDAPGQIGFILPAETGGFIAGLQQGLFRFDERDGSFTNLCKPEPDQPGNRLNDATVDPLGRLWFGSMDDGEVRSSGTIYRLAAGGTCVPSAPLCSITNGPAVSPDGKTIYHISTLDGLVWACDIADDGSLSNRREFARIPNDEGYPDGPTVDAEGCVWIGMYAGWSVKRFSPRGELLETIRFPVSAITKVAFGGPDLKTLYCTTANKHLNEQERELQPQAGDLFEFRVDVPGLPGHMIVEGV